MPTENELKYVLDPAHFPLEMSVDVLDFPCCLIHQGYLFAKKKSNLRVRSCEHPEKDGAYILTFKRTIGGRVVEVNTEIDKRDFVDLWGCAKIVLRKVRYDVDGWDVDFFIDVHNYVYFVLAEHEMPEGQEQPESMPDLVSSSLLYEVPRDDDRFSSKKLADIPYAKKLLQKVKRGLTDGQR